MKRTIVGVLLVTGAVMVPVTAAAQTASVYAVHGIPGAAGLPVDVSVQGGGCISALNGFTFGEIRGPLALPPGTYTLEIRPADAITPCGNAVLLTSPALAVAANQSYSVVAHLDASGTPTISAYVNDVSRTEPGKGRVLVHHTAYAPAVDVTLARGGGKGPSATLAGVSNPQQGAVQVQPGEYQLSIAASENGQVVFTMPVSFSPFTTTLVYAIGGLDGSFQLAAKVVPSR